jgi:diaminopimelate epimerase
MKKIRFTKMVASGNDFVVLEKASLVSGLPKYKELAKIICDRKFGVGADGLLLLQKTKNADIKMRIFNSDGSEAQMCGNGGRCVAFYAKNKNFPDKSHISVETNAGIIDSVINGSLIKIKLTQPKDLRLNFAVKLNRVLKANFINTGVPHLVIFTQGLDRIDVETLGRILRFHKDFAPAGTNVNFVEITGNKNISVRTYERGVEGETHACGTGSVASAIISAGVLRGWQDGNYHVRVLTKSKEVLQVYFDCLNKKIKNVWLQGTARIVYQGDYYV